MISYPGSEKAIDPKARGSKTRALNIPDRWPIFMSFEGLRTIFEGWLFQVRSKPIFVEAVGQKAVDQKAGVSR
jgi:hypothetical protein